LWFCATKQTVEIYLVFLFAWAEPQHAQQ
jgi:hypothetical protein